MSKFSEFSQKVNTDPEIKDAFLKILRNSSVPFGTEYSKLSDDVLKALVPVAKKAGYDFTLEEVKDYFAKSDEAELSEDELEGVAGGKGTPGSSGNVVCRDGGIGSQVK